MPLITYGASRAKAYHALQAMDNKSLRAALQELQDDLEHKHRRYIYSCFFTIIFTLTLCLGLLLYFNSIFADRLSFNHWLANFVIAFGCSLLMLGFLSHVIMKRYWAWRGRHRIWLEAIDVVTIERFGGEEQFLR